MFGKLGRSGAAGRGPGKRPLSTPVQLHRPGEPSGARPPIGAAGPIRARHEASSLSIAVQGREETFRLEPGELDFGAIIRLTPDIVEEIRRLEAQGGAAKIKFDANANNPAGNVVDVGGKEFSFTWSRELTDLCDIYEERQNGDDGDGLLVECGAAWRKLNVQRILDESTKNHVKMRSEEAERMLKARKAIVLDPTNPSVKNQAKSMAAVAVEGNMRRMGWKHNKEMPSKKRKVESSQGVAALSQSKLVSKSATASYSKFNGIPSPVPSPQQPRPHTLLSNSGIGKTPRGDTNTGAITPPQNINKEEIEIFVKEMPIGESGDSMQETNGYEERNIDPPVDLQNMLITLLSQNPKGMSFKALEQAIGDMVPNSVIKMENALKNIATLQTPGRYFLKQGRQVESSTRSFEGGSSPECSNKLTKRAASVMSEKTVVERLDQDTRSSKNDEASDPFEKIDIMQDTEDAFEREEKARDNVAVRGGSSSESGSDSDSESSSSGSDSGSQSKSKAGSGSASSSDSESDGSSSSKEASDEDVDIMTSDDEKGTTVQCLDTTVSRLSSSPRLWGSNSEHDIIDTNERDQKANGASPALDLHYFESVHERVNSVTNSKNLPIAISDKTFEKLEAKTAESYDSYPHQSKSRSSVVYQGHNKVTENQHESPSRSFNNDRHRLFGIKNANEEQSLVKDDSEQLDNHESVTKTNTKRSSNSENFKEKPQNAKRMKASSSAEASFGKGKGARSSDSSISLSPERSMQKDQRIKKNNNYQKDDRKEIFLDENLSEHANSTVVGSTGKVLNCPDFGGPPNFSAEQSGRKVIDSSGIIRTDTEKPIKYFESNGRANKHLQAVSVPLEPDISALKNMQVDKISKVKGKQDKNCGILDKYCAKSAKGIILGDKMLFAPDSVNRKSTDAFVNEKGNILRREFSDLELGEFREPLTDFVKEDKRPFERKNSFKKNENKVTLFDSNIDMNMGKCDGIRVSESKKHSPSIWRGGMNGKVSTDDSLDLGRSQSKVMLPQSLQSSNMDVTEPENMIHLDKCAESGGKNGTRTDQVLGEENETSGPKKTASTRTPKDDNKHGVLVCRKDVKRSKTDKLNGLKRSTVQGVDGLMTSNGTDSMKSLEFTSDEENAPYMKYKETELDLKGPIKDFSIYKDYVQEYQKKYNHYCSLNKKLEKIRNYFLKVGDDLELARGRDMEEYYNTVDKLRQMYYQHGEALKQRIKEFAALQSGE